MIFSPAHFALLSELILYVHCGLQYYFLWVLSNQSNSYPNKYLQVIISRSFPLPYANIVFSVAHRENPLLFWGYIVVIVLYHSIKVICASKLGMEAHTSNPSYSGDECKRVTVQGQPGPQTNLARSNLKKQDGHGVHLWSQPLGKWR
jgi:hypothetical protein